jgi:hypothetical protein
MSRWFASSAIALSMAALVHYHPADARADEVARPYSHLRFARELQRESDKPPATLATAAVTEAAAVTAIPVTSDDNAMMPKPLMAHPRLSDAEMQSVGCLVTGLAGTGVAMAAGGVDVINLIAGGLVPVSSNLALGTALVGVVFASFCAVGQALTPAALMIYNQYVVPEADPDLAATTLEKQAAPIGSTVLTAPADALERRAIRADLRSSPPRPTVVRD